MSSTLKHNIKKGLQVLGIFIFAALFIAILITAKAHIGDVVCNDIEVSIAEQDDIHFVDEKDILDYINNNGASLVINQRLKDIDKSEIEARIEKNAYVANAEVFTNFEGKIKVKVEQKNPIYRVFNNKGVSYYVSNTGESIPISSKFTPRLIVATGYLPEKSSEEALSLNQQILTLVNFINEDEFWNAMIGQFYLTKNGDFILYPKIGEHKVILGSADNLEEKFKYLNIFYKEAIKKVDWKKYNTINLKFKGQIICTKNN
jgi:cell division protein FtsQ